MSGRDTVLLLHGLSRKDKLFTVHCVEVLHQYHPGHARGQHADLRAS